MKLEGSIVVRCEEVVPVAVEGLKLKRNRRWKATTVMLLK